MTLHFIIPVQMIFFKKGRGKGHSVIGSPIHADIFMCFTLHMAHPYKIVIF